ncbi:DUF6527 family protein [Ferrovibrio sp.]|uniref:DUF6527 family protein n=1 Tax=Ferrovibrio sp. TaxID=1917215 RepID=UPI00345C5889
MPKVLEPGVLYVSEKYSTAAHLCACGCGEKIRTPLGPTEWSVRDGSRGPSLWPSVGSWQRPCRSHYIIDNGDVHWSTQWSDAEVQAGRASEQARREAYFESCRPHFSFWRWLRNLFR